MISQIKKIIKNMHLLSNLLNGQM